MRSAILMTVGSLVLLAGPLRADPPKLPPDVGDGPYSHAYYLFQVGPLADGSDRLIPMLLTSRALENTGAGLRGVLVWTYERDSVSLLATDVPVGPQDVKAEERHVQVPGFGDEGPRRWYRYQRVGLSEARRLLAHPEGVIPVHRIGVAREALDALLQALPEAGE